MKFTGVIVLTVLVGLAALISSQDMQMYCGRRLSEALAQACPNGLMAKRSQPPLVETDGILPPLMETDGILPWIPVHEAKSLGRTKRQVVYECCFKPCSLSELTAYCAP